jgi:hypothetical protein
MGRQGYARGSLLCLDPDPTRALSLPPPSLRTRTPHLLPHPKRKPTSSPLLSSSLLRAADLGGDRRRGGWDRVGNGYGGESLIRGVESGERDTTYPNRKAGKLDTTTTYSAYTRIPTKSVHICRTLTTIFSAQRPPHLRPQDCQIYGHAASPRSTSISHTSHCRTRAHTTQHQHRFGSSHPPLSPSISIVSPSRPPHPFNLSVTVFTRTRTASNTNNAAHA